MSLSRQLLLAIGLPEEHRLHNFIGGQILVASLERQILAPVPADWYQYLWGPPGSGCTHLLQACCHLGRHRLRRSVYLCLKDARTQPADAFRGLEQLDLVCLDDIQSMAGEPDCEEALFDLFNRCRQRTTLVIGGRLPPAELPLVLPDLRSRLASGPVWRLPELQDQDKLRVLIDRASQRGMFMSEEVAQFMLNRLNRDMGTLVAALDRLDHESLQLQRRLTIALVKEVLGV